MRPRLIAWAAVLAWAAVGVAGGQDDLQTVTLGWGNGYMNVGDHAEYVPAGYYTGASTNIDANSDGTASKRFGSSLDDSISGTGNSVNGMFALDVSKSYYSPSWGLVFVDSTVWKRNNESTAYTQLTVPNGVVSRATDILTGVVYDGVLVVGGQISALMSFDGDNFDRTVIPQPLGQNYGAVDTLVGVLNAGGALDSAEYQYKWTWENRRGDETYGSPALICTTSTTCGKCSTYAMPEHPDLWETSTDTSEISVRQMYRSADFGQTWRHVATLQPNVTTWVDSGQYVGTDDIFLPSYESITWGRHLAAYDGKLWTTVGPPKRRSPFILAEAMGKDTVGGADYTLIQTTPPLTNARSVAKLLITDDSTPAAGWFYTTWAQTYDDEGTPYSWVGTVHGISLRDAGVVPGDYYVAYDPINTPSEEPVYRISAVLTDSTFSVQRKHGGVGSIGRNIFQIDNELIAAAYPSGTGTWYLGRTLGWETHEAYNGRAVFGTDSAAHDAGSAIYYYDPNSLGEPVSQTFYRSENLNANRFQTDDPFYFPTEEITGLFSGDGYLGVVGRNSVSKVWGQDDFYYTLPITENVGSYAEPLSWGGGAFLLDYRGPYYLSGADLQFLGRPLGSCIRDSAFAARASEAKMHMHESRLYISVVDDASLNTTVYVADLTRTTDAGDPVWTRYDSVSAKCFATWTDDNDKRDLYFGSWQEGAVFQFDKTIPYDEAADGTDGAIEVVVQSPTLRNRGQLTYWDHLNLSVDTNDTLTVYGTFSDGPAEETRVLAAITAADSSARTGAFREHRIDIGQTAQTMYFTVEQSSATSRFTLGPVTVSYKTEGVR